MKSLTGSSAFEAATQGALFGNAIEQKVRQAAAEAIRQGDGVYEWRQRLNGIVDYANNVTETIGRTTAHRAYNQAMADALDGPIGNELPYWLYLATRDTRTRKTHLAMNEKVAHRDSPMAKRMAELLDEWGCRCTRVPISREEAVRRGIDDNRGWKVQIQETQDQGVASDIMPALTESRARFIESVPLQDALLTEAQKNVEIDRGAAKAFDKYARNHYRYFNDRLRGVSLEGTPYEDAPEEADDHIKNIRAVIQSVPPLKQPVVVFRGARGRYAEEIVDAAIESAKSGKPLEWNGLGSASLDPKVALLFSRGGEVDRTDSVMFEIVAKRGLYLRGADNNYKINVNIRDEFEFLQDHGTKLRVKTVVKNVPLVDYFGDDNETGHMIVIQLEEM